MNKSKVIILTLAVAIVAAVGIAIVVKQTDPPPPVDPTNQFTAKIEQEIEQLKAKPNNQFCKDVYISILAEIKTFHSQKKFGEKMDMSGKKTIDELANDQWKENLEKYLYAAYAEKFIEQAKTIFRGSAWSPEDLKFIQVEKDELKKSELLIIGSPVDKEFTTIQTALNKYHEIVGFISSCNGFSYSGTALSDRFPIADVQSKIQRAASLRSKRLGNEFVNNCTRLHNGLKEIPQALFKKHTAYLDNKISYWSNMWCNYNSHSDYSNNLNRPLRNEINDLSNSTVYDLNVDDECNRLFNRWSADNQKAYDSNFPCNN